MDDDFERLASVHNSIHSLTELAVAHLNALIAGGFDSLSAEYLTHSYYAIVLRNFERKLLAIHEAQQAAERDEAVTRLAELLKASTYEKKEEK